MANRGKFLTRPRADGTLEVWAVQVGDEVYPIAGGDGTAEAERKANEAHRVENENERLTAEQQRIGSEASRAGAEVVRANAEGERSKAETARNGAESSRVEAEDARKASELAREKAEEARKTAEEARRQAESARESAEGARVESDAARTESELERAGAEAKRVEVEAGRERAEASRSDAEAARAEAEAARAKAQEKNNADQALNNEAMKKLAPVILANGQYDPDTLAPTIEGEANRMYLVPMPKDGAATLGFDLLAAESGNAYAEWMWIGGKWELVGQSEMKSSPITTDEIDAVLSGESREGEGVLSLTGLSYMVPGLSKKGHTHAKADVTGLRGVGARGGGAGQAGSPPRRVLLLVPTTRPTPASCSAARGRASRAGSCSRPIPPVPPGRRAVPRRSRSPPQSCPPTRTP